MAANSFYRSNSPEDVYILLECLQLSGHTTLKQCQFNVDSTSWHLINVKSTLFKCFNILCLRQQAHNVESTSIQSWFNVFFESTLLQRCVPAGAYLWCKMVGGVVLLMFSRIKTSGMNARNPLKCCFIMQNRLFLHVWHATNYCLS